MKNKFWPSKSSEWTEVAPEEQGLDSKKIAAMFELIEKNSYDIHSVIVVRNGYLLVEEYLYNSKLLDTKAYSDLLPPKAYSGPIFHDQASTTKSLMSILIGIALQEGFLDNLSQTLYEFFADIWEPSFVDSELKKNITIEQLLTMNSGLIGEWESNYPHGGYPPVDCIKLALDDVPLGNTPGEAGKWVYSNDGINLLSGIITNITGGKSTKEFAKEYLFTPLGISENEYDWLHDSKNINYGGYGFLCSPKVQAKLGILCLNNGAWKRAQIVDSNYIKNATTVKISLSKGEVSMDYGYLFFMMDTYDGYYMAGAGGQTIYVISEYNITVGFTAGGIPKEGYDKLLSDYIIQFAEDN